MTRSQGETIQIRPTNNIYTALAVIAVIVQLLGFIAIMIRAKDVGGLL